MPSRHSFAPDRSPPKPKMQNSGPRNSQSWTAHTFASQKVLETPSPRSAAGDARDSEGRGYGLAKLGSAEFANPEHCASRAEGSGRSRLDSSQGEHEKKRRRSSILDRLRCNDKEPRCGWANSEIMIRYHDEEWGTPVHGDRRLFEFLILEGAQAGLSWQTILRKRENYRSAFDNFNASVVARYGARRLRQLVADPGIVRNRLKISSAVQNARALLAVQEEFGSFNAYIWRFVGGKPRVNGWRSLRQVPARTAESDAMSKDLRQRGFKFVGSTICYAFMQATGMVNDHLVDCFRHAQLKSEGRR
jgi:DNA-3-methyladenine glycosylase I